MTPCPITADRDAWRGAVHTPGPWRLKDGSIEMGPEDGKLGFWATFGCGGQLPNPSGQDCHDEVEANARLAWCSPELLAHLEWAVKILRAFSGNSAQVQAIDECIARAKGNAS